MRPFSAFRTDLDDTALADADAVRLRSLATWAHLLLRPGMEFVRQRSDLVLGWQGPTDVPPIGSWMLLPDPASPATRTALPSHDALHGAAHLELDRSGPVVVSVPSAPDSRYFSVAVMDAHMNNIGHVGPRWTGPHAVHLLVVPPGWAGTPPRGMVLLESTTVSICLYSRMLLVCPDDVADLDLVRTWQAGLALEPLDRWGSGNPAPAEVEVDDLVHPGLDTLTDAVEYLRIGLAHLERNPLADQGDWLSWLVRDAGFVEAAVDPTLRRAVEDGTADALAILDARLSTWPRANGWTVPDLELALPNPKVDVAAAFQQIQIGSNQPAESVSWFADTDAGGEPLDGARSTYELTFTGASIPRLHPGGHWSVTVYDGSSRLVPAGLGHHCLGPDTPGVESGPDGRVTFVVAADRPAKGTGNWLTAPRSRFRLGLRMYYPVLEDVVAGWVPPAVSPCPGDGTD